MIGFQFFRLEELTAGANFKDASNNQIRCFETRMEITELLIDLTVLYESESVKSEPPPGVTTTRKKS